MTSVTLNTVKATIVFHDVNWQLFIKMGDNSASITESYPVQKNEDSDPCYSITMNGVKATIVFNIEWSLLIEYNGNWARIHGLVGQLDKMEQVKEPQDEQVKVEKIKEIPVEQVKEPTVEKVKEPQVEQVEKVEQVKPMTDKTHIAFIKNILNEANFIQGKQKAECLKTLYDYLSCDALDFVYRSKHYKKVAIKKAHEFKKNPMAMPELIKSIDNFLTLIGEPLKEEKPEENAQKPEEKLDEGEYITNTVMEDFQKWEIVTGINSMDAFIEARCDPCCHIRDRFNESKEPVKEMKEPVKEDACTTLMKQIFEKRNIPFLDVYMDMYCIWKKDAPKVNRYKKMCMFIDSHKF